MTEVSISNTSTPATTASVESILALRSAIGAAVEDIDCERRLPDALVAQLKGAGAFRALIPRALGGLEVPFAEYMAMIQQVAEVDASTAWCVNQGAVIATTSLWLPTKSAQALWSRPEMAVANGPPLGCELSADPDGRAKTSHHWLLTGRWGFSSGCQHAAIMTGAARVANSRQWRVAFFSPADVTFHDTWQVSGLRGTGSFEFSVDKLAISDEWVADLAAPATFAMPITQIPTGLLFAVSFASLALGVARAALTHAEDIATGKHPIYANLALKDDPEAQREIGEAEIRWRAAEAFLYQSVNDVLNHSPARGEYASDPERIALRMAGTHVIREASAIAELAYSVAGSTAIYTNHPIHRQLQDMRVITQHVQARRSFYSYVGRHFLGHNFAPGPLN